MKCSKFFTVSVFTLFLGLIPSQVLADQFCTGYVATVAVSADGKLGVSLKDNKLPFVYLCNLHSDYQGSTPDSCKSMHSTLLSAYAMDKEVNITFSPSNSASCSDFPSWSYVNNLNWVYFK